MAEQAEIAVLDDVVRTSWDKIQKGRYFTHVRENGYSVDLYRRSMTEMYHYTSHNSINQAFAVGPVSHERIGLLRYAYEHAAEELGHEKMVRHDLESIGLLTDDLLAGPPLPATQALIGYLYSVAFRQGAVARLGYSYWAEDAYPHIDELLTAARRDLGIGDKQMSFFVAHSVIDAKHADEVRDAVRRYVETPEEMQQVIEVARTTLYMTGALLDNALDEHLAHGE